VRTASPRAVAARGVRQVGEFRGRQVFEQRRLARVLADIGAADRHRHDLGARGVDRRARLREILYLPVPTRRREWKFLPASAEILFI
jgi:hypothetical protein